MTVNYAEDLDPDGYYTDPGTDERRELAAIHASVLRRMPRHHSRRHYDEDADFAAIADAQAEAREPDGGEW